jgi:hypothetical protein
VTAERLLESVIKEIQAAPSAGWAALVFSRVRRGATENSAQKLIAAARRSRRSGLTLLKRDQNGKQKSDADKNKQHEIGRVVLPRLNSSPSQEFRPLSPE